MGQQGSGAARNVVTQPCHFELWKGAPVVLVCCRRYMGVSGDLYRSILVVHLLCAIGGFGAVVFNGLYGLEGRRRGSREALVIAEANHVVGRWARRLILATFASGIALVLMSKGAWSFTQLWVWLSTVLFLMAFALAEAVVAPAERSMRSLLGEMSVSAGGGCGGCGGCGGSGESGADQETGRAGTAVATSPETARETAAELALLARKMGTAGGVLDLALVAIVALMVFKPGS